MSKAHAQLFKENKTFGKSVLQAALATSFGVAKTAVKVLDYTVTDNSLARLLGGFKDYSVPRTLAETYQERRVAEKNSKMTVEYIVTTPPSDSYLEAGLLMCSRPISRSKPKLMAKTLLFCR